MADVCCSLIAIALERAETEAQLAHQALHDGLTGLPNRTLLLDRLDHALARRRRTGADIALLFCDIDRFKVINDSLGHNVGDQLLVAFGRAAPVGRRARATPWPASAATSSWCSSRTSTTDDHPTRVAEELADALARPVPPAGRQRGVPDRQHRPGRWPPTTAPATAGCATPTPPCTGPRKRAGTGWRCSTPRCATRP